MFYILPGHIIASLPPKKEDKETKMVLLRSIYATMATVLLGAQSVAAAPVASPDIGSDISSSFQEAGDKIKSVFERCVPDDPTSCGSGTVKREAGIGSDIKSGFEDAGEKIKSTFTKRCVVDDPTPCESEIS